MNANVGNTDQLLWIVAGIISIALILVGATTLLGWIGAVPLLAAQYHFAPP
jgi:membrane protein implicated in regulation of membrane protease activity